MSAPHHFIGGVGGSGTRVVASICQALGYHYGSDRNQAEDSLWFALFFMRQNYFNASQEDIASLASLYAKGFYGGDLEVSDLKLLDKLLKIPRPNHGQDWLSLRKESFIKAAGRQAVALDKPALQWGWKAPNTHIYAGRFLKFWPKAKYIHVWRDGLDMALSKNQNQLRFWGQIYPGGPYDMSTAGSLDYWCAVHRTMLDLAHLYPGRVHWLNFDALCHTPAILIDRLLSFLGETVNIEQRRLLIDLVRPPKTIGRSKEIDLSGLRADSLEFAMQFHEKVAYDI